MTIVPAPVMLIPVMLAPVMLAPVVVMSVVVSGGSNVVMLALPKVPRLVPSSDVVPSSRPPVVSGLVVDADADEFRSSSRSPTRSSTRRPTSRRRHPWSCPSRRRESSCSAAWW
jgi:hypothetical protein